MNAYETLYQERVKHLKECSIKTKIDYSILSNYDNFKDLMSEEVFKTIIKSKHRKQQKRCRCNKKLKDIILLKENMDYQGIKSNLLWVTCTFNEKEIRYKEETRAKKLDKWVHEHFITALIHIDYGDKTNREHYHFVGLTTQEIEPKIKKNGKQAKSETGQPLFELIDKDYKLGHEPSIEVIKRNDEDYDLKAVSNYLIKLQNHYTKATTKRRRIRVI